MYEDTKRVDAAKVRPGDYIGITAEGHVAHTVGQLAGGKFERVEKIGLGRFAASIAIVAGGREHELVGDTREVLRRSKP